MRKRYGTKLTSRIVSERRLLTLATVGGMPVASEAGVPVHPLVGIRPIAITLAGDPDSPMCHENYAMKEQGA